LNTEWFLTTKIVTETLTSKEAVVQLLEASL